MGRTTPAEIQWQAESIGNQVLAGAPDDVGFLVMFFLKGQGAADTPVGFATNEHIDKVRAILREFERKGSPIVTVSLSETGGLS